LDIHIKTYFPIPSNSKGEYEIDIELNIPKDELEAKK
jgi:hypothetical protein